MSQIDHSGSGKSVPGLDKLIPGHGHLSPEIDTVKIKRGRVENIGPDGKKEKPAQNDAEGAYLAKLLDHARAKSDLTKISEAELADGQLTRILLMPLSGTPANGGVEMLTGNRGGQIGATKKDVAVCFSFRANNVNDAGTSGQVCGVAVMSNESARALYEEVVEDPTRIFEVAETINGGPIRRQDGSPATIEPGNAVVLLPNNNVGGKLKDKVMSKPFSSGFKPN